MLLLLYSLSLIYVPCPYKLGSPRPRIFLLLLLLLLSSALSAVSPTRPRILVGWRYSGVMPLLLCSCSVFTFIICHPPPQLIGGVVVQGVMNYAGRGKNSYLSDGQKGDFRFVLSVTCYRGFRGSGVTFQAAEITPSSPAIFALLRSSMTSALPCLRCSAFCTTPTREALGRRLL